MRFSRLLASAFALLCAATAAQAQIAFRAANSAGVAATGDITHIGVGAFAQSNGCPSNFSPGVPAGVNGDLLVALVASKDSAAVTRSAGWNTLFAQNPVAAFQSAIYWRIATGADALTVSKTGSGCNVMGGQIARFRNVDQVDPFQTGSPVPAANWSYQNSTTVASGTETTSMPNAMLLFAALIGDNNATGTPTGFTASFDSGTATGSDVQVTLKYRLETASGLKGPFSVVKGGGADPNHGVLVALRPAGLRIGVPVGTVAGDTMVASIAVQPSTMAIMASTGWTLARNTPQAAGSSNRMATFYRIATAPDVVGGVSYAWTFSTGASTGAVGGIASFSGVDAVTPIDAEGGNTTASSLTHTANAITTVMASTMLVGSFEFTSTPNAANWTSNMAASAVNQGSIASPSNNGLRLLMAYETRAAIGATGTRAATASGVTADTGLAFLLALRPAVTINHFAISHAGSGVACADQAITITAHDASHAAVDANSLLVNLSTTNAKGSWTAILAGGGTLIDATAGDGAATYQFAVGSNSVQLAFRYANLAATSETFGFNVSGGGFSEATGTASGTDDPSFTMAQAGFQFRNVTDASTTIPTQISGKPSNTGWNQKTIRIRAIRTDTVTGSCTGLFASQTRSVDLGAECNSPVTCAARQVSVNATNIATSNNNGGAGAAAYTGVSLAFSAASEADTVIIYPDAGQISLHARYDLDPLVAGFEMIGSSNTFVVRPFGLAFPGINHSSTAAGSLIGAAGDNFAMTVQAYQWAAGEDANNDGIPDAAVNITDNGTVPNFAATATVAVPLGGNLPGIADGAITRGVTCAGASTIALTGGTASAADWCYSEVGNVNLTADVTNYISAGINITGNSGLDGVAGGGYVGRFKPKYFAVTGAPTLTNRSALACAPASTFTYMNEGLSLGFTLEARNTQNALTQNYTGAYAKLDLSSAASLGVGARSGGGTNLTGRVDSSLAPTGSFTNGSAALVARTAITRAIPDNPDGPYTATQFGIAPNDVDGVQMQSFNQDVDGVGGNDHFAVGPTTELRFGRLWLQNTYGSGSTALKVPIELQFWNGIGFAVNGADSCTTLPRSAIAQTFSAPLAACNTAVNVATVTFTGGIAIPPLLLTAPGAGATGSVLLTANLGTAGGSYCNPASFVAATSAPLSYLLGRWDDAANPDSNASTAYDDKPTGRATFGLYGSQPKNFIFFRENF